MTSEENVYNNLSDDTFIVIYMNLLFLKPKDPISSTLLKTYNGRLKSMKMKDYYDIDEIEKQLDEVEVISTRKISCNAFTHYYIIELEKIYKSARTSDGNFNYTNEPKNIIKIIKPIKDMLAEYTIVLGDKYEEKRNKNELSKVELESFITWDNVIKMRDNMPETDDRGLNSPIYIKLLNFINRKYLTVQQKFIN